MRQILYFSIYIMKDFFNECNSYTGRWNRKKFWLYPLGMSLLVLLPIWILFSIAFALNITSLIWILWWIAIVWYIYVIYVSICSYIKRFHDLDRSGHFTWLAFIPYIWIIAMIWCGFFKWSPWVNRFGPNPLDPTNTSTSNEKPEDNEEL